MTPNFTTDNIDQIVALPLCGGGWKIGFRSGNEGCRHQLYMNGRLADWTSDAGQRTFIVTMPATACQAIIAAVEADDCQQDFSALLAAPWASDAWVYQAAVLGDNSYRPGTTLQLLTDHCTGVLDPTPVAAIDAWPAGCPRWAWGEDSFGQGGFGYDGARGPGMGCHAFGAGPMGIGWQLVTLQAPLAQEGTHQIVIRATAPDGRYSDLPAVKFPATPPPPPPLSLEFVAYDGESGTLTVAVVP
jgi:hypothetical protein